VPTAYPDAPQLAFWWDRLYSALSATQRRDDLETAVGRLPLKTTAQRDRSYRRLKDHIKTLPHDEALLLVERISDQLGAPPPVPAVMSWDTLRRLAREGVTLGAHTRTHPMMNRISPDQARAEAVGSLDDLKREIGSALPIFAYPSGGFSDEVVRILAREGFALAFTTVNGINQLPVANRLRLRRMNIGRRTTLALLRARLLPWSVYFDRWRPLTGA
jgi:peptidoglycan/xylan/chitin deacetylase (PgdA/CDA1 family)